MNNRPSQKKVSTACSYCKLRKRKCSVTLPCDNCVLYKKECVYDDTTDGRRKASIQRAKLESALHKEALVNLIEKIRTSQEAETRHLILGNAAIDEIVAHLTNSSTFETPSASGGEERASIEADDHPRNWRRLRNEIVPRYGKFYVPPGYVEVFGNLPFSAAMSAAGHESKTQMLQVSNFRIPEYMIQPLHFQDDVSAMTVPYIKYRDSCRDALANGSPEITVLGPAIVSIESALRGRTDEGVWTPSTWVCELQRQYPQLDVFVRLATIYFVATFLRWHISPTAENYALMPDNMRPTMAQRLIPHHAAIDLAHHPAVRDMMIQYPNNGFTEEDRIDLIPYQLAGLRTPWTAAFESAVALDTDFGCWTLSRAFVDTIDQVEDWTAGCGVLETFPQLLGTMQFAEQSNIAVDHRGLHEMMP